MTLEDLRSDPASTCLLLDVDGTLAPIVQDHDAARVPPDTAAVLAELAERYLLVACVSGRHALDARRIVGLDQLVYAGNHGFELLMPGETQPSLDSRVGKSAGLAADFASSLDRAVLARAGVQLEDKGPIQALHWRGAADVATAEAQVQEIAALAEEAGLDLHRGRLVLELRPKVAVDKGVAVRRLIELAGASAALYAGDDRTDLDAFGGLRQLAAEGTLRSTVCVGVASDEGPVEIQREADVVVDSPADLLDLLRGL